MGKPEDDEDDGFNIFTRKKPTKPEGGSARVLLLGLVTNRKEETISFKTKKGGLDKTTITLLITGIVPGVKDTATNNVKATHASMTMTCKTLYKKADPNRKVDSKERSKFTRSELLADVESKRVTGGARLGKAEIGKLEMLRGFFENMPESSTCVLRPGMIVNITLDTNGKDRLGMTGPASVSIINESMWEKDDFKQRKEREREEKEKEKEKQGSSSASKDAAAEKTASEEDSEGVAINSGYKLGMWLKTYLIDLASPAQGGYTEEYKNDSIIQFVLDAYRHSCAMGECPVPLFPEMKNIVSCKFSIPLGIAEEDTMFDKAGKKARLGVLAVRIKPHDVDAETGMPITEVDIKSDKDIIKALTLPISVGVVLAVAESKPKTTAAPNKDGTRPGAVPCVKQVHYFNVAAPHMVTKTFDADPLRRLGLSNAAMAASFVHVLGSISVTATVRHSRTAPHSDPDLTELLFNSEGDVRIDEIQVPWNQLVEKFGLQIPFATVVGIKESSFFHSENIESELGQDNVGTRGGRINAVIKANSGGMFLNGLFHPKLVMPHGTLYYAVIPPKLMSLIARHRDLVREFQELNNKELDRSEWIKAREKEDRENEVTHHTFKSLAEFLKEMGLSAGKDGLYKTDTIKELMSNFPEIYPCLLVAAVLDKYSACLGEMLFRTHFRHYPEYGVFDGPTIPFDTSFSIPAYVESRSTNSSSSNTQSSGGAGEAADTENGETEHDYAPNTNSSNGGDDDHTDKYSMNISSGDNGHQEPAPVRNFDADETDQDGLSDHERQERDENSKSKKKRARSEERKDAEGKGAKKSKKEKEKERAKSSINSKMLEAALEDDDQSYD